MLFVLLMLFAPSSIISRAGKLCLLLLCVSAFIGLTCQQGEVIYKVPTQGHQQTRQSYHLPIPEVQSTSYQNDTVATSQHLSAVSVAPQIPPNHIADAYPHQLQDNKHLAPLNSDTYIPEQVASDVPSDDQQDDSPQDVANYEDEYQEEGVESEVDLQQGITDHHDEPLSDMQYGMKAAQHIRALSGLYKPWQAAAPARKNLAGHRRAGGRRARRIRVVQNDLTNSTTHHPQAVDETGEVLSDNHDELSHEDYADEY